jgi:RNA polymerase sigma-70 factor, ECF subfamily
MHADNATTTPAPVDAEEFERLLATLRPKLHRYCARMVGSVIEAEDVVQDTLMKAVEAFPRASAIGNAEAWLFRIGHMLRWMSCGSARGSGYSPATRIWP